MLNCHEFETLGPGFGRDAALKSEAEEHLRHCSRCAALHELWLELRGSLRALASETQSAETPQRVEMALRDAVRAALPQPVLRRLMPAWRWSLAATAAVALLATWFVPRIWKPGSTPATPPQVASQIPLAPSPTEATNPGTQPQPASPSAESADTSQRSESAANGDEFVALPYAALASVSDDTSVVRVRMQRGALGAFGLPVNEERADEWVMVDLLVSADGEPQAVRLSP